MSYGIQQSAQQYSGNGEAHRFRECPEPRAGVAAQRSFRLAHSDATYGSPRLEPALRLYEQNFAERTTFLGPDHSDTHRSRDNLAEAYRQHYDPERADPPHK